MTTPGATPSRHLTLFVSGVVLLESAFYAVVPPLVPVLVRETHMTTTEVGLLTAAYPAGILVAAIPSVVLVNTRGARKTTIVGLSLLVIATLGFGWGMTPTMLDVARLVQGIGGALTWAAGLAWLTSAASDRRRASTIGGALGAALTGGVLGPIVGAAAAQYGRAVVFSGLAAVLTTLTVMAPRSPTLMRHERSALRALASGLRDRRTALGSGLLAVVGVVNGTIATLVPLVVARHDGSPAAIAVIFGCSYSLAACWNVLLGRLDGRLGRMIPTTGGLVVTTVALLLLPGITTLLPLAIAIVVASSAVSGLWTPAAAMVIDGAPAGQSGHAVAVAIMNVTWGAGGAVGAVIVSRIADSAGFPLPFDLVGGLCGVATVVTLVTYPRK